MAQTLEVLQRIDLVDRESEDLDVLGILEYGDIPQVLAPEVELADLRQRLLGLHGKELWRQLDAMALLWQRAAATLACEYRRPL